MMPNIKEIALKVASEYDKREIYFPYRDDLVNFAEALVAELAEGNEPLYQFRPECDNWIDCTPLFFESWRGEKRIVYTLPPTASQIEQETAEAICELLEYQHTWITKEAASALIRSGAWKEFKKS